MTGLREVAGNSIGDRSSWNFDKLDLTAPGRISWDVENSGAPAIEKNVNGTWRFIVVDGLQLDGDVGCRKGLRTTVKTRTWREFPSLSIWISIRLPPTDIRTDSASELLKAMHLRIVLHGKARRSLLYGMYHTPPRYRAFLSYYTYIQTIHDTRMDDAGRVMTMECEITFGLALC